MIKSVRYAMAFAAWLAAQPALAALNIFACEPEWGALAKELGGDKANVYVATNPLQDPHHVEARPSLIARARSADLVVCSGAELEIGWLPLVQTQSGNPRIQLGQPGYFEAARHVVILEVPRLVDRSQGDVHPGGQPAHPTRSAQHRESRSRAGERMAQLDPPEAAYYQSRTKAFSSAGGRRSCDGKRKAAPLKGMAIVVHHKNMSYLERWLGMREVGELEPKPGLAADDRAPERTAVAAAEGSGQGRGARGL